MQWPVMRSIAQKMIDREQPVIRLVLDLPVVDDSSQVLLRSKLRAISRRMGFIDHVRERMELVCNEMATNQRKYTCGGHIQIWEVTSGVRALDIFAIDYSNGISDLKAARADGFTTAGTMGRGLGAIGRLSHDSAIYSLPKGQVHDGPWHGTAIWSRFYLDKETAHRPYQVGIFLRALHDDIYNGDAIYLSEYRDQLRWLHMDGLGHGQEAAEVVAGMGVHLNNAETLPDVLDLASRRMRGGRGAVAILGELNMADGGVTLCGVGDMMAATISEHDKRSVTFAPGVLGHSYRQFEMSSYDLSGGLVLLTASDGLRRSWSEHSFPGLWQLHPQLIALLLGSVVVRTSDDKSIFIVRKIADKD